MSDMVNNFEVLRRKTAKAGKKLNKFDYYSIEQYRNRIDEAFGVGNLIDTYTDSQFIELSTGQGLMLVTCNLSVLDNDNIRPLSSGVGTYEVARSTDGHAYVNLSTAGRNATTNAFKSACSSLGIFGINEEEESGFVPKQKEQKEQKGEQVYVIKDVYLAAPPEVLKVDEDGRPIYTAKVQFCEGAQCTKDKYEVLIYPSSYERNINKLNLVLSGQVKRVKVELKDLQKPGNDGAKGLYTFRKFI